MIRFAPADGCLDLQQTLDCGQAFRWQKIDTPGGEAWRGTAFSHTLTVRAADGAFLFDCTQAEFDRIWYPYFDFGTDYAEIRRALSGLHPVLRDAAAYAPGIRILRQEPWEALCTFILSQNNNIPRIKGIVERLCAELGDEVEEGRFSFPSPERLAECLPDDLANVRCGFRTKYLLDAARRVADGRLELAPLLTLPLEQAREELQTVYGVVR